MATLIDVETKRSHALGASTIIGRAASCQILIDDPLVSANHAAITKAADGSFRVRDLDSQRGTYLGSLKITEAPLSDGDEIVIGTVRMRFEEAAAARNDREELTRLRAIFDLGRTIGVEHDLGSLVARVLDTCFQLLRADRGALVIYRPRSKAPLLTMSRDRHGDDHTFELSTSVLGRVMAGHEPYLRTELDGDLALRGDGATADAVRSVIAVPLRYESGASELLGVIVLDSAAATNVFQPRDLELLAAIAGPTALAVKNAMLVRQVELAIGDEWQRLERVVRDLPLGVIVLDDRRRCVLVNQWVAARAADLGELRPGSVVESVAGVASDRLTGADIHTHVTTTSERILSVAANTTADGRETVIVINDLTEERDRQNQAAHRDRVAMIGQLASGVAHDFNNMLHVILTYSTMLEDSLADPDQRDDAHQITHAATSAAELTRKLLTFSRRELVKPKVVDVTQVVHGMEKMLLRTLGNQIEFAASVGARIPNILMDAAQLEQILLNLMINARDAMVGKGKVTLSVDAIDIGHSRAIDPEFELVAPGTAPGRYVAIAVSDTGSGMPPEVVARIFEPYFTTKARGKGTGLGLATVHGIVQQARGDIAVESAPGEGTTFRILIPATDQTEDARAATIAASQCEATILVVDDDDDVRRVTERMLRNAGYKVLSAVSGPDALAIACAHPAAIDLVLSDIVMPGISGLDLARQLDAAQIAAPVVFMSGYHQHRSIASARFISKPFGRTDLLDKIGSALNAEAAAAPTSKDVRVA